MLSQKHVQWSYFKDTVYYIAQYIKKTNIILLHQFILSIMMLITCGIANKLRKVFVDGQDHLILCLSLILVGFSFYTTLANGLKTPEVQVMYSF